MRATSLNECWGKEGGKQGHTDLLISLENVKSPPYKGFASLRRLIVLE
jgi:hypothetical protein